MVVKTSDELINALVGYALAKKKRFIFISGNGGSGKSELAKRIVAYASQFGHSNAIDMDEFVVDTALRKSASLEWEFDGEKLTGRCTTSFKSAYFIQNIHAIIANVALNNNYYHWPKKAKSIDECKLIYGDAVITVVEGIGSVFLNKSLVDSISIFIECDEDIEIARRLQRKRFSNEQTIEDIKKSSVERNSQYKALILPHRDEHDLILTSNEDYSFSIAKDKLNIIL
ncbi:MAG: hypothetical protein J1G07_00925 [Clostridiales bacterium]|nr:hypothetical protein [Clostridiales bacterium]